VKANPVAKVIGDSEKILMAMKKICEKSGKKKS
jgi:hypothetical protein